MFLFPAGRGSDCVLGLYVDLRLKQRQEMFSLLRDMLEPSQDRVILDLYFENGNVRLLLTSASATVHNMAVFACTGA